MKAIVAVSCWLAAAILGFAAEDVDRIVAGIAARQTGYHDLQFTYNVRVKGSPPLLEQGLTEDRNAPAEATYHFWILRSDKPDILWRNWRRYLYYGTPQQSVDQFASWNGEVSRTFIGSRTAFAGAWNRAVVRRLYDPQAFQCNVFDDFLFLDLTGLNQSIFDARHLDLITPRKLKVTTTEDDPVHGKVTCIRGYVATARIWYETRVTDAPDFMVVSWTATTAADGRVVTSYQTTDVGHLGSLAYPRAGKFSQSKLGALSAYEYEFDVVDAQSIDQKSRQEWDAPWPARTVVSDLIKNQVLRIADEPSR